MRKHAEHRGRSAGDDQVQSQLRSDLTGILLASELALAGVVHSTPGSRQNQLGLQAGRADSYSARGPGALSLAVEDRVLRRRQPEMSSSPRILSRKLRVKSNELRRRKPRFRHCCLCTLQ